MTESVDLGLFGVSTDGRMKFFLLEGGIDVR
ncbi:hypothetical protein C357_01216 [Citreicella sp. 357]|nr:hypothetical protein C357_01216 [Citreicella sp. 357]